jgi:predicted nucleotidyltransferase
MYKNEILTKIKDCLRMLYSDRLQNVLLFGSEAQGESIPDSDIDIMVILNGPVYFMLE